MRFGALSWTARPKIEHRTPARNQLLESDCERMFDSDQPTTTQQTGLQQSWPHSTNRNRAYTLRNAPIVWELARQVCQEQQVNGYAVPFYNAGM
jgi:hypothetical protein